MEFQKSEYFQKRAHKFYPSISRGFRLLTRGFRPLKSTQSSLSRDSCCLSISLPPRDSLLPLDSLRSRGLHQASFLHFHLSSFISHRTPARKSPERLFSPSQRTPKSSPTTPPEISRFLLPLVISTASRSSSGVISPFSSFFHRTRARKSPERLSSPSLRPPESFPTTPPEISRFPFGTKVIKILDLSLYLSPTRPFAVSPTLPYSPKPVLPISKASPSPTTPPDRIRSSRSSISLHVYPHLTLSYDNTHQSSSSLPTITKSAFPTGPSALLSFLFPKTSPSPTTPPDRIRSSRSSISLHVYPHLTLSYNNTHQSSSSLPTINKFAFPTGPSALLSFRLGIHNSPRTELQGIARNLKRSASM